MEKAAAIISPGDVIEFFEQKRIMAAIVLQSKNEKLVVLTETSRQMNLPLTRVLHRTARPFAAGTSPSGSIEKLRLLSKIRDEMSKDIMLSEIWEALEDESSPIPLEDFLRLIYVHDPSPDEAAAFVRAVYHRRNYFEISAHSVSILTRMQVDDINDKAAREAARVKERDQLASWLVQSVKSPKPLPEQLHNSGKLVQAMRNLAAGVDEFPDKHWLKDILKATPFSSPEQVFQALVKLDLIDPDENLELIRNPHFTFFSSGWEKEYDPSQYQKILDSQDRRDLRHLTAMTIDSSETKDMDDAISIRMEPDGCFTIGIHITDIAAIIPAGCVLDSDARARSQTLYMPDRVVHMLPSLLSESAGSLLEGSDRLSMSILVRFSPRHYVIDYEIVPAVIHVARRLTYDQIDHQMDDPVFAHLHKTASMLRAERIRAGALIMSRPELEMRVDGNKKITLRIRERETPSQIIVSECMILANRLCAEFAVKNEIPLPYRCQDPPSEPVPALQEEFDPLIAYRQRRVMNRAMSSIEAREHYSLAVPCYTNITSPLRRYFDLLAQRQIESFILDQPLMTKDQLAMIIYEIDANASKANQIVAGRESYWLLKHLSTLTGQKLQAVALDQFPHKTQIWLSDFLVDADLPASQGRDLIPGEKIQVIIEKSDPLTRTLKLRLMD